MSFLSLDEESDIIHAIQEAEKLTSGEIKVHICSKEEEDSYQRAIQVFQELRMFNTLKRNAVLFHISTSSRSFSIIGDIAIDKATPNDFWDNIRNTMLHSFKVGKFSEGIIKGIEMTGVALKAYFPIEKNDNNQLPNEITYS